MTTMTTTRVSVTAPTSGRRAAVRTALSTVERLIFRGDAMVVARANAWSAVQHHAQRRSVLRPGHRYHPGPAVRRARRRQQALPAGAAGAVQADRRAARRRLLGARLRPPVQAQLGDDPDGAVQPAAGHGAPADRHR